MIERFGLDASNKEHINFVFPPAGQPAPIPPVQRIEVDQSGQLEMKGAGPDVLKRQVSDEDLETAALMAVNAAMAKLDHNGQIRVLHYMYHRYDFRSPTRQREERRPLPRRERAIEAAVVERDLTVKPTVAADTLRQLQNNVNGRRLDG